MESANKVNKKYCHDCCKEVNYGEIFCEECYRKKKFRLLYNLLAFTFGFCSPLYAMLIILIFKNPKLSFYKSMKLGLIMFSITIILMCIIKAISMTKIA